MTVGQLTDEQSMLRESVRGALAREAPLPRVREALERGDADAFAKLEARQGWCGIGLPEVLGGQGGGAIELAVLAQELGRVVLPSPFLTRSGLLAPLLGAVGAEDLQRSVAISGAPSLVLVVSAAAPPTCAPTVSVDANGRLNGTVAHVLDAADASELLVPAAGGLYLVAAGEIGLEVTPRALMDRTRKSADVLFDRAAGQLLCRCEDADVAALGPLVGVLLAADSLGVAERMLEMTVEYVGQRQQFGVAVGSFQAVKHLAADMLVAVETARSAAFHAASSIAAGLSSCAVHAAAAKALCAEAAAGAADIALALHGAIGYTWEHDLHLFFKRAKLNLQLFGSPAAHRELVAAALDLVPGATAPPLTTSEQGRTWTNSLM